MSCFFHPQEYKQQQCEGLLDPQQEKSCSDDLRRGQLTADVVSERPTDRQTERERGGMDSSQTAPPQWPCCVLPDRADGASPPGIVGQQGDS